MPGNVPESRRRRRRCLDAELSGRRRPGKSGSRRRALILRAESRGVSPTEGYVGNCQHAFRFSKSELRSGQQCRGSPSSRRESQAVSGTGSPARHRAGTRVSGRECRRAIQRRAIAAPGRCARPHFANDWARRLRPPSNSSLRRRWNLRAGLSAMRRVWRSGWRDGRCR